MSNEQAILNVQWNTAAMAQGNEEERGRPFMLLRPRLFPDGNMWCALYGDNPQDGVAGFGETPEAASRDFDHNWMTQRLPVGKSSSEEPANER